ncbi:MAG: hypothetical protein ACREHE_05295 [Rhizomicrobium sp.]
MVLSLLRRSNPKTSGDILSLAEAARRVLEIARVERLALAYVAGRDGEDRAQHWFATNICQSGIVQGHASPGSDPETLGRDKIGGLELDPDMNALREPGAAQPRYVDLSLTGDGLKRYLDWVRTVQ